MHTSVQITALQQLLKDLAGLKAQVWGGVWFPRWEKWSCPSAQPSPAQNTPGWLLRPQPQSHQIGQENSQHPPALSPILAINSGVFLLKPQQIIAAPYSLILDLCSKSSSNSISVWCERVIEFQLWHVSCARAHHMLLGLLLCSYRRTDDTWSDPESARTKLPHQNIMNKFEAALWTCISSALSEVWLQLSQLITGSCKTILTFFEGLFDSLVKADSLMLSFICENRIWCVHCRTGKWENTLYLAKLHFHANKKSNEDFPLDIYPKREIQIWNLDLTS